MKTEPQDDDVVCEPGKNKAVCSPKEDKIVREIPVYLTKSLTGKLHVFQYPVLPNSMSYDDENILQARVKPVNGQVELELGLKTRTPTYCRRKGEEVALNVDGACRDKRDSEDNYFASNTMDKLVLTSNKAFNDVSRYAVGVMGENSLHLTNITSLLAMRPSFTYLDMAEKRIKMDQKEFSDDSDSEEKTKKVTVRFERPETERSKSLKENSYNYIQKQIRDEPWIPVNYNRYGCEQSEFESRQLFCSDQNEKVDQFCLDETSYLKQLIPTPMEAVAANPGLPSHLLSMTALKALPLQGRLCTLMQNASVASFMELCCSVANGKDDASSILKVVQQVAVLVQGNWVVKSDIIYPKESTSESTVSNEFLQRTRDCTLYLLTKNRSINRTEVCNLVDIPPQDLTKVLKGISRCRGKGTWEFLLPTDNNFLKEHPEVVQRQQMIWKSRYEQLSQNFFKIKT